MQYHSDMKRITLERQPHSLTITNHDHQSLTRQFRRHSALLGNGSKRALIVGGSNCGKTNVMISLLEHPNGLRFENIYLYCKTLDQPKYSYLRTLLAPVKEIGFYEYVQKSDILPPMEAKPNSIIIFDDVVCDNQSIIRDYFCFGRHRDIDCFYLCQTYSSIPKQLVRDNANLIALFKQDNTNLKHIYDDHVNVDMSFDEFRNLSAECWKEKYGFLVIDKDSDFNSGRYRKGFDIYIT